MRKSKDFAENFKNKYIYIYTSVLDNIMMFKSQSNDVYDGTVN